MIKRTLLTLILSVNITCYGMCDKNKTAVIGSGGAEEAKAGKYVNETAVVGQLVSGRSSENKKHMSVYAGYVPAFVRIEATDIVFYDPSPAEKDVNNESSITCKITIEAFSNNIDTGTVRFRISNSGRDTSKFSAWYTGAKTVKKYSNKKIRYSITIPTSANGMKFKPGDDNYIQWRCWDSGNNSEESGMYNIRLREMDFEIIQPLDFSSLHPVFEARFSGPLDEDTIDFEVNRVSGGKLLDFGDPDDYDSGTGIYRKRWEGADFTAGERYELTLSARDTGGEKLSKSVTFTVNEGAIADLIPYPSPFDPSDGAVIRYVLDEDAVVSISFYDTAGDLVYVLVSEESRYAGLNDSDKWFATNYANKRLANGVYFCEVVAEDSDGEHRRYTALAVLRR
ncbi:MAG: hypothetical protein JXJ19_08515 [Elusimicrobia bacterium]|nr:hypothetical protein [Elusimicrobiota bacterium]